MSTLADYDVIPTHITSVARAERIRDSFVRITFSGGLDRYEPLGPDDFVYVLLPPPGRDALNIDTSFRWTEYYAMDEQERPVGAYYTVRAFRPEAGEIDCDVYLHEPSGIVSRWAPRAAHGHPVALWGPRTAWNPPSGTTDWLLVADETGLPAVCAILEQRQAATRARVVVEVADADHHLALPGADGVEVTWVHRDGREAGTTDLLATAVRDLPRLPATTYAWGGAESRTMTTIRRYLRHEVGLPREQVSMTGYWRHANHAADATDTDD